MIIVKEINNLDNIYQDSCIAIGNFDGIHEGHTKLIKTTIEVSKENNLIPVSYTHLTLPTILLV